MLRLISTVLICLSVCCFAAPDKTRALRELKKLPSFKEGAKAMADELPDVAVGSFRTVLANKKLSSNARIYAQLYLAEALVSASLAPQAPPALADEALKILTDKSVSPLPSSPLWQAEALAGQGRYQAAATALANVPKNHPEHTSILMARARIMISLRQGDSAIKLLTQISQTKSKQHAALRQTARLLSAEIHLDHGRFPQAIEALKHVDDQHPRAAQLKQYLQARLSLSQGSATEAIEKFQTLINSADTLTERIHHASVLGMADAQTANKQNDAAIVTLEKYITAHPESSALQPLFMRLARLLPAELPNDQASMKQLIQWSNPAGISATSDLLAVKTSSAASMRLSTLTPTQPTDLQALALFYRAKLLSRSKNKNHHAVAMALLARLRMLHSTNLAPPTELWLQLSSASLLETANLHLLDNNTEAATFTLAAMEKVAFSPKLKNQASFLRGLLLAKAEKPAEALAAFDYARESASEDIAVAAQLNTGIASLLASDLKAFKKILISADKLPVKNSLLLERALWKCSTNDPTGRAELDSFILANPNHPRENEARMALASACVNITPPDVTLARAQLDTISPRLTTADDQFAITRIRIRAEDLAQEWKAAAAAGDAFVKKFPDHSGVPAILFLEGESLYHNEDYGRARTIFQSITEKYPKSKDAGYARFYTALAARHGGTDQARQESIALFKAIIKEKHPLSSEARIQLGRVQIDLSQLDEAEATLKPLVTSPNASASPIIMRSAGILLADCLHRGGATDTKKYLEAVAIYQLLLKQKNLTLGWSHRIHFLCGQSYQAAGDKLKAFSSYYSVIVRAPLVEKPNKNEAADKPKVSETEWLWFYRCGFKALAMLESDKRWHPAVKLAKRIASFPGPRAEEAKQRADILAKKHQIWEE